jgi:hypothetical protein
VQEVMVAGVCCERCPGATMANTSHIARRRLLKAAVFQPQPTHPAGTRAERPGVAQQPADPEAGQAAHAGAGAIPAPRTAPAAPAAKRHLYRAVTGRIVDVSPHFIAIGDNRGEQRFTLTTDATAWRGAPLEPSALTPGDQAVIRLRPGRSGVADRIWANIGRVSGTIIERDADSLLVQEGTTRRQQVVVIPSQVSGRMQVRFPNLVPGFLIDVIGIRRPGGLEGLEGLVPATYQPPYRSSQVPVPEPSGSRVAEAITGSAIWHDSCDEPYGVLGVYYPAVDPAAGCAEEAAARIEPGQAPAYRRLPYLAVGSALAVHNECSGISWTLPVTGCAPTARLFNDRCVVCGTSDRGRVADLTVGSFVALGGELERGCFNATITIGR